MTTSRSETPLLDEVLAQHRKETGMALAAAARGSLLAAAQECAAWLGNVYGEVTSDMVAARMQSLGLDYSALGNASGSVFRGNFVWTGRMVASIRPSTHARMIKVWRPKEVLDA